MSPTMRVYVATNLSCSLWLAGDMLTSSRGCGPANHSSRDGSIAIVTRDSLLVATAGVLSRPFERTVCQRLPLPAVRECTPVSVALVRPSERLTRSKPPSTIRWRQWSDTRGHGATDEMTPALTIPDGRVMEQN